MVAFINTFLSYLLLCLIFMAIIVCAVLLGKKLRDNKDAKTQAEAGSTDVAADNQAAQG